jgi:S1-C subfamily serine protease
MLHSDPTEPFQPSWQGSEEEPHQARQSHQPNPEENGAWPEMPPYEECPREMPAHDGPPLWHTSGKLSVVPTGKLSGRRPYTMAVLALTTVIATVFGIGLFAGWTFSQEANGTNALLKIPSLTGDTSATAREAAIAKVKPAVVQVNVTEPTIMGQQVGHASGVVVDKAGYIVTNNYVIEGSASIEVVFADGTKVENVQVAGTDPVDDLAVLKIDPPVDMVVAQLGDSSTLQVGEDVLAIGTLLGMTETVTHGIISALDRSVQEYHGPMIPDTIQTDAPVNLGNGGGALADLQGNVIGIPTLIAIDPRFDAPADGLGFAIPINQVKRILPQIIQDGSVTHTGRATLDITSSNVDPNLQSWYNLAVNYGVYVTRIDGAGPAAQAGLQRGDVIVQVNGQEVDDESSLEDMLATEAPGDKVSVTVYRGDQQLAFTVTLGELQAG